MRRPSTPRSVADLPLEMPAERRRQLFDETWKPGPFDYERLDAHGVAREALLSGMAIVRALPEDHVELRSQLRRALVETLAGTAATASLTGEARQARAQATRASASEAAALLDALMLLDLATPDDISSATHLLGRLCAMLSRLALRTTRVP